MKILGIETSADDTGVALIEGEGDFGPDFRFRILGNEVASQTRVHAEYGGIYPNLAKREHARAIVPVLERVLREARILKSGAVSNIAHVRELLSREPEIFEHLTKFLSAYERPEIDFLAVTVGPGLEPCLWTGINLARVLADIWKIPVVGVNHMEGHLMISIMDFVNPYMGLRNPYIEFPTIALLISGGHTELILMKAFGEYAYLGRTRDDAVGEAFDKVARLLDLPYPGGPEISRLAKEARTTHEATPRGFALPRPMIHENNFDFSFAGLKTAVLRIVEKHRPLTDELKMQIAREFEDAAADVLVTKTMRAAEEYGANAVIVGGGVSANTHIRLRLAEALAEVGGKLLVCPPEYSTDNGLMIALAGYFHARKYEFADPQKIIANGNLKLC